MVTGYLPTKPPPHGLTVAGWTGECWREVFWDSATYRDPSNQEQTILAWAYLEDFIEDHPAPKVLTPEDLLAPTVGQHWGTKLGPHLYIQAVSETYVEVRLFTKDEPMVPLFGRLDAIHRANWARVVEENKLILLCDR